MVIGGLTGAGARGFEGPIQVSAASVFHSGEGVPDAALGDLGDFYVRNDAPDAANALYVKLAAGWSTVGGGVVSGSGWFQLWGSGGSNMPTNATRFLRNDGLEGTEGDARYPIPRAVTMTLFRMRLENPLAGGTNYTFRLMKNGVAAAGIGDLVIAGPAQLGTVTGSESIALNDEISIRCISSATASAEKIRGVSFGTFD